MSEKKEVKSGRKTVIALLIVVVVLAASLGGVFYYLTSVVNAKNSTISSLQTQISSLQTQLLSLEKERNDLMSQVSSLEKERDGLRSQVSSLQSQISSLQAQISSLERERDNLRSQLSSLQSRLSELEDIVNLRRSTTLKKDKTVNLRPLDQLTFSYSTPYAGYITITFTATAGVDFWVSSSFTGGYYTRYPLTETAFKGSFTVPVFTGTTSVTVRYQFYLGSQQPSPSL